MTTSYLTEILPPTEGALSEAVRLLNSGEVVVLPSETVYGLAARCDSEDGIAKIFSVKNRPADNPLILHCDGLEMAKKYSMDTDERLKKLADIFWPGPLTVVVKRSNLVSDIVTAGQATVALRVPNNEFFRNVITECGVPIAAPSANISGRPSPTDGNEALRQLDKKVPLIVDGGRCDVGVESTIIYLSDDEAVLLRPGDISADCLSEVLGQTVVTKKGEKTPTAPGMKYRHYAPNCEIILYCGDDFACFLKRCDGKYGVVCFEEESEDITAEKCIIFGRAGDEKQQQRRLFKILNSLDDYRLDRWYIHTDRSFKAVYNRLHKASDGKIFKGKNY